MKRKLNQYISKRAWDECYAEFRHLTIQYLRDNTGTFKKNKTITNLILVLNREEVTKQLIEVPNDIKNEEMRRMKIDLEGKIKI